MIDATTADNSWWTVRHAPPENEELMRHTSHPPERDGGASSALDKDQGGSREGPVDSVNTQARRHLAPLSLRTLLILVVLAPMAAAAGFASSTAVATWSSSHEASVARSATLELDSLMRARAAIQDEHVLTGAIVYAAAYHMTPAEVGSLLGINLEAELVTARQAVDRQSVLRSTPLLTADYDKLLALRRAEALGKVTVAEVESFFGSFSSTIDGRWLSAFGSLSKGAAASAPLDIRNRLAVLGRAFTAFTAGLEQATVSEAVLTAPSSPGQVEALIDATDEFQSSVQGFPGQLGPQGSARWEAFQHNPQVRLFDSAITLAIQVGLRHAVPPYATSIKQHGVVFKGLVERLTALTNLVLGASADLRASTADQQNAAANGFVIDMLIILLLFIIGLGGALSLGRAVGKPLAQLVRAASAVRAGEFDLADLDESGPRELAVAAGAFNEMSSTLRAVEAHAVALAEGNLRHPVLDSPLPGTTGRALQSALDQLHESIQANETQRDLLHVRATHDSLTGLLNREAAVDALERDLARARRGDQALSLLFIDLDGLKAINDTFGHEGGDSAIRAVAEALSETTRQSDVVARLGGDEFVVGWLGSPDLAASSRLAERIRQQVSATVTEVGGVRIPIGCSIGIALSEPSDLAVDTLMKRADRALYLAKADGRGRVRSIPPLPDRPTRPLRGSARLEPGNRARPARPVEELPIEGELSSGGRR